MAKRGHSREYTITEDQRFALLKVAADSLGDQVLVILTALLGMRASEVCHMNRDWLHDDIIQLPPSQDCDCIHCLKSPKHPGKWQPKYEASRREIPMPDSVKGMIYDYFNANPKGFQITRQAVWAKIKLLARKANIKMKGASKGTTFPHALRASAAENMIVKGFTAEELMCLLGWSRIDVANAYIKAVVAKAKAYKKVKELL